MSKPGKSHKAPYDPTVEQMRADAVIGRYFDVDIQDADSAYDVLVDNGIHPQFAAQIAQDMYPEPN